MGFTFQKATRKQSKLRLALIGPSGAGKTYSALSIAKHLGKRVAVIDSECGSASKYAGDVADFDVLELDTYAPRTYVEAIRAAEQAGYDVIVIDSLSHAWAGKGGALEMVDNAAKRSKSGNSYTAWRDVTPEHNALVDALVGCKAHLIVTMRAKTEYVLQDGPNGKKTPTKIGMAPIQRDGLEYEFDVVAELDLEHTFLVSKTRCSALDAAVVNRPGEQVARKLLGWLGDGAPAQPKREAAPQRERPFEGSGSTAASATSSTGERDEYGLAIPAGACPVVSPGKPNAGKPWSELPGGLLEKMYSDFGDKMSAQQRAWAEYLMARRAARKAREAAQAEMLDAGNEGGGYLDAEPVAAGGE